MQLYRSVAKDLPLGYPFHIKSTPVCALFSLCTLTSLSFYLDLLHCYCFLHYLHSKEHWDEGCTVDYSTMESFLGLEFIFVDSKIFCISWEQLTYHITDINNLKPSRQKYSANDVLIYTFSLYLITLQDLGP